MAVWLKEEGSDTGGEEALELRAEDIPDATGIEMFDEGAADAPEDTLAGVFSQGADQEAEVDAADAEDTLEAAAELPIAMDEVDEPDMAENDLAGDGEADPAAPSEVAEGDDTEEVVVAQEPDEEDDFTAFLPAGDDDLAQASAASENALSEIEQSHDYGLDEMDLDLAEQDGMGEQPSETEADAVALEEDQPADAPEMADEGGLDDAEAPGAELI